MNQQDERLLLKLARKSIETKFSGDESCLRSISEALSHLVEKQGVFVTLHRDGKLRGCVGIPEPVMPLREAVIEAARSAAFADPRFLHLREEELKDIKIEISVLTVPEEIIGSPEDILDKVTVGKDGLIIRSRRGSGLLLPQVATEQGWDVREFLENLCIKAGLPVDAWKDPDNRIYAFQARIFSEK